VLFGAFYGATSVSIRHVTFSSVLDSALGSNANLVNSAASSDTGAQQVKTKLDEVVTFMKSQGSDLPQVAALYNPNSVLKNDSNLIYIAPEGRVLPHYESTYGMRVGLVGNADPTKRGWRIVIYPDPFLATSPEESAIILYAHYLMLQDAKNMSLADYMNKEGDVVAGAWSRTLANVYEPLRNRVKAPQVERLYNGYQNCQKQNPGKRRRIPDLLDELQPALPQVLEKSSFFRTIMRPSRKGSNTWTTRSSWRMWSFEATIADRPPPWGQAPVRS